MPIIGYPSSDFPPPPRFSLNIPEDWQATWLAGTLLAVHGPANDDGVVPNVLVAHERLPADASFDEFVARTTAQLRDGPPARDVNEPQGLSIDGAIAAAFLAGSFIGDGGTLVFQRQVLVQVSSISDGTAIMQITATFAQSQTQLIEGIVRTFAFTTDQNDPSVLREAST